MIKKITVFISVLVMGLNIFCGCDKRLPYNAAVIVNNTVAWQIVPDFGFFTDDFWRNNMINVIYENENYNPEDPNSSDYYIDETLPSEITYIIRNQKDCDNVFIESQDIDFEKEMVLIYMCITTNSRLAIIKDMKTEDKKLTVKYKIRNGKFGYKDACMPKRRIIVIKMNKLDVDTAEFIKINNI